MARFLSSAEAAQFYDGFGAKQDKQGFYEDAPLAALAQHLPLEDTPSLFEFGCGTGRFARGLLEEHLPGDARYAGCDVSQTMLGLAQARLCPFGSRITLWQSDEKPDFSRANPPVDLIVSCYVLDLLPPDLRAAVLAECARALPHGGHLGLVSLTWGNGPASWLTSRLWSLIARYAPRLVGGCRPISLAAHLGANTWNIVYDKVIPRWTIPSEVLIATRR